MITMIDYGIGNYRSVIKGFEHVGAEVHLTRDADEIAKADKLALIGVGAFRATMRALREREQIEAIKAAVGRGTPLLGICVGMQVLFEESTEFGYAEGLGFVPGSVCRFPEMDGLKVPHMGWNQLAHDGTHALLHKVESVAFAYFVHSYYCAPRDSADVVASTEYGLNFTSIVNRDNVYGIQFHGEKSQAVGLQILRNFNERL